MVRPKPLSLYPLTIVRVNVPSRVKVYGTGQLTPAMTLQPVPQVHRLVPKRRVIATLLQVREEQGKSGINAKQPTLLHQGGDGKHGDRN